MKKRTEELMQMLEKNQTIMEFINNNNDEFFKMTLAECLSWFLSEYDIKKSHVINRSGMNPVYAYQIFAGTKKPSRDRIIAFMFGFLLSVEDANRLLQSAGFTNLYPRDKRDAIIIFGLHNKLNINEVDDVLFEFNLETISR